MKPVRTLLNPFRLTLTLHRWLPRRSLCRLRFFFASLCLLSGSLTIVGLMYEVVAPLPWFGLTLIAFGLWLDQFILYAFNNSRYFRGLNSVTGSADRTTSGLQYLSATVLAQNPQDCVAGFFHNPYGQKVTLRLGIDVAEVERFLTSSRPRHTHASLKFTDTSSITLTDVARRLFQEDSALRAWLLTQSINETMWLQAVALVEKTETSRMRQERWWSRDNLSRNQSLGRELSFGYHHFIQSVSRPFQLNTILATSHPIYDQYVTDISSALAKQKASNVLLVGTEGGGVIDVLARLQFQYATGQQLRSLHHPHIYEIDMDIFFSRYSSSNLFAYNFERLLNEAATAGNIILVFTHFSSILERANQLGIDLTTIIDDYLISPALHIILVDSPTAYHNTLRHHIDIVRHCTEITIDTADLATLRTIVTDYITQQEPNFQTTMTIKAIEAIVIDADRYLTVGDMPDRAITLADSILTHAARHQLPIVDADAVHSFVHNLTNVPVGPISDGESDMLIHLEDYLEKFVAGQPTATKAVARTMRRARADIERHNKPIGSFLFLGPTGVGKTETAKTLAHIFFEKENSLIRFDMSEYSQRDALIKLIGDQSNSGQLTIALNENPYTVLLLDEFEKAHQSVHDLFLQILDEGFFTTGAGEKINTRSTIIIATSNAGSDLISRTVLSRHADPHLTQEVIRSITQQHIFRPELLNRFDNIVVFDPLRDEAKRAVVIKFLNQLVDRLAAQNYTVTYDDTIISLIINQNFDPTYGARPMQRFIQNLLEDYLAKMILEKTIAPGQLFTLTAQLFSSEEIEKAALH